MGTVEERQKTAETNRGIRAQQQLLRAQQNRQAIALAGLRQESGLLANVRRQTELLDRETRNAGGGARLLSRTFSELAGTLGAIGITEVAFGLVSFGRNVVEASVRVEGFRNSLTALYGDAQIADRVLGDLQEAARLPGITFEGAVQGAIRLKTVQIEGDRAQSIITEFGNAAALSGASAEEMNRALVGLTQTVARGQIEQDNLNQILENVPLIGNAIREAFGSIDAETIREVLESAGNDVNDFVDILTNQLSMGARASADTTTNAFSNLRNSTFELSAAIGDSLTPSVRDAAMFLTGLLDGITGFLEGSQFGTRSAEEFTEAISGTTQSVRELLPELDEYIRRQEQRANNPRGVLSGQELEDLREAKELYDLVSGAVAGNSEALAGLEARTMAAKDALDAANAEQERLKAAIDAVDPSIRSERDSLQGLNADLRANTDRLEEAQSEYNDLNRVLTSVTQEADSLKQGISELEAPTTMTRGAVGELDTTIASADTRFLSFNERADTLSGSIRALPPDITAVREGFDVLAPTTERVNAIFTTYNETLGEYVRVSGIVVTSAQAEQEALDAVTQGIVQQTQDAEGLAHVQEVLTQRTDAHNAALVNPAVSDAVASLRNYANIIGDVNIGYDEITPATQDFVDGLVDQESAFDDLREATDAADLSLGVLDGNFDKITETISNVPNATDDATESFRDFSLDAIEYIDDITRAFSPLFDTVGDVGAELENFSTLITSLATGNVLGVISSTANIILPGLTDPQRILDFEGLPTVEGDPRQIDTSALGLTPVQLEQLDFSGVAPGLLALLEGGEGGFNVPQARSRTQDARSFAEATGTDRQAIEDVAREQYGAADYAAEVAAATGEALEGNVEPPTPDEIEAVAPSTALQRNVVDRARFEIGLATDEDDFEARRQAALDATNAFHDAEIERINALELSEEERQDQLEDNQLARERGIHRLTELDNTFTETRLANERAVQEEIERTNAMRARAAERAEAEAQREAERQARASERAEAEAQREAERQAQAEQRQAEQEQSAGIGLLRTDVQRAQFDLGLATDEDDFEARRQAALDATNAFHDAEAERIDGLMLSETQLANQRAANALARERAIHRLTTAENTFETQRIRAAERAEQDAQREAERQARASERAEAEAQREAERQAQAEQRAQERAEREAERQTEAEQREQERAEAEAQRQADREQSAGIGLLRTDVQRAQFDLGLATDESDFEARRQAALDATNAFHDAEAERIDGLVLSEVELANLREANVLARERAIHRLTTAENTFETQRLRDAEEAARAAERANEEAARLAEREAREAERVEAERIRAAERAERERTRLIEREQRERQRIAERQQREAERANEQRIREEMRTQDRIDDLRDDAFDNEERRQQRIVDLERDTQDRITEIHRRANQSREGLTARLLTKP